VDALFVAVSAVGAVSAVVGGAVWARAAGAARKRDKDNVSAIFAMALIIRTYVTNL
jgi:hypothetical protein